MCLHSSDIWEHSSIMLESWDICPGLMSSFGSCLPPEVHFPTRKKFIPGWLGLGWCRHSVGPRKVSVDQAASGKEGTQRELCLAFGDSLSQHVSMITSAPCSQANSSVLGRNLGSVRQMDTWSSSRDRISIFVFLPNTWNDFHIEQISKLECLYYICKTLRVF